MLNHHIFSTCSYSSCSSNRVNEKHIFIQWNYACNKIISWFIHEGCISFVQKSPIQIKRPGILSGKTCFSEFTLCLVSSSLDLRWWRRSRDWRLIQLADPMLMWEWWTVDSLSPNLPTMVCSEPHYLFNLFLLVVCLFVVLAFGPQNKGGIFLPLAFVGLGQPDFLFNKGRCSVMSISNKTFIIMLNHTVVK